MSKPTVSIESSIAATSSPTVSVYVSIPLKSQCIQHYCADRIAEGLRKVDLPPYVTVNDLAHECIEYLQDCYLESFDEPALPRAENLVDYPMSAL